MAIFKSLSLVCDKYNVSEEVEIMIEENIQKILFMKGWTEMKSFDKQAQKMKKNKRDCQIEYYPFGTLEWVTPCQTFNLTCFDTIHKRGSAASSEQPALKMYEKVPTKVVKAKVTVGEKKRHSSHYSSPRPQTHQRSDDKGKTMSPEPKRKVGNPLSGNLSYLSVFRKMKTRNKLTKANMLSILVVCDHAIFILFFFVECMIILFIGFHCLFKKKIVDLF